MCIWFYWKRRAWRDILCVFGWRFGSVDIRNGNDLCINRVEINHYRNSFRLTEARHHRSTKTFQRPKTDKPTREKNVGKTTKIKNGCCFLPKIFRHLRHWFSSCELGLLSCGHPRFVKGPSGASPGGSRSWAWLSVDDVQATATLTFLHERAISVFKWLGVFRSHLISMSLFLAPLVEANLEGGVGWEGGGRLVRFQWFCPSFFLTHRT